MIQKIRYIDQKGARLLLINQMTKAKPGGKTDTLVNDILREITNRDSWMTPESLIRNNTKIRELSVNPNVVGQAQELRKFYDEVIAEQNSMREIRGQDPIPYRGIYSPEILRDATLWEKMMNQDFSSEQVSKGDLPDYIKPNKPFNPRELARKHGIPYELRVKSALDLAEKYVATAAKDIFNTSIIQNNKAFIQQLETMGLMGSAQVLSDWTSRAYGGVKPPLDRHLALPRWGEKALNKFNRVRNLAVFPLNLAWSVTTQTSSLALTIGRFGSVKTAQGLYNWLTSPKLRKEVAEDYYSYIIKAQKGGRLTRQDSSNLVGQKVKVYKSALDIANDAGTIVLDQMEKLLTGTSIEAGRLWGKKRGLTGDALKQFASDAGAKTQSMYNDEDKPQLLTNLLVKSITPYQTFAFELVNTMREWSGQTGTPPNTKMDRMWTIIRFIAAAAVFQAIARKVAKKDVYSWKNPPLPFAEYWWTPIASSIAGDGFQVGSSRNLPSPVLTVTKIGGGIKTFIENGESRKLRNELLKYGPGFFGVGGGGQLSRTVDAIWAYAEGGVYDKNGKRMFVINEQNLPRSIFSGVWSTEGGQHYLGKQSEAPDLEKSWWKQ